MSADERLTIWRYATPAERQRVIDAEWQITAEDEPPFAEIDGRRCCPWGAAVPALCMDFIDQESGFPMPYEISAFLRARLDGMCPFDLDDDVANFVHHWDEGEIPPYQLQNHLRRLNAEEAAQ